MELEGKVAMVTGGVGGIGQAVVEQLLRNKAKVCICDINSEGGEVLLQRLKKEFSDDEVIFKKCDVTDPTSLEEAFRETISSFKQVSILFNNAGIMDEGIDRWRKMIDINLTSVIEGTYLAFKYMNKNDGGHGGVVINTSSVGGVVLHEHFPAYSATKHAVKAFSQIVGQSSEEMYGVRVNAFGPYNVDTGMLGYLDPAAGQLYKTPNLEQYIKKAQAMKPYLRPDDVARYVLRLVTEPGSGRMMMIMPGHVSEVPPVMKPPELPALYDD